jgi:hypothetical protein
LEPVQKFGPVVHGLDCNPWPNVNWPGLQDGRFKTADFDDKIRTGFAAFDEWTSQEADVSCFSLN